MHEQADVAVCVLIVPPKETEHSSSSYYQLQEIKMHRCGQGFNGIIFIPYFMIIRSFVPELYG
jgi:hypothetical protein